MLWDPILNGDAWVAELSSRKGEFVFAGGEASSGAEPSPWLMSPRLLDQFRAVDPALFRSPTANRVLVLETEDHPEPRPARELFGATNDNLHHEFVPDASPWIEDVSIWSGQIPHKAVRRITEWLQQ